MLGFSAPGRGQSITMVTVTPANPTPNDPITIITQTSFTYYAYTVISPINVDTTNNTITIQLFKCHSQTPPASVLTDTFQIGTLPADVYTVNVLLFVANQDTSGNCGGYVMVDTENFSLTVGTTTSVVTHTSSELQLYPNPASAWLFVRMAEPSQMSIIDLKGQIAKQFFIAGTGNEAIDVSDLPAGIYTSIATSSSGKIISSRLVITR